MNQKMSQEEKCTFISQWATVFLQAKVFSHDAPIITVAKSYIEEIRAAAASYNEKLLTQLQQRETDITKQIQEDGQINYKARIYLMACMNPLWFLMKENYTQANNANNIRSAIAEMNKELA